MKKKNVPVRDVFLDDESRTTKNGIIQALKGEPTLTVTIAGAMGSGKTVLAHHILGCIHAIFWTHRGEDRWRNDVRVLIKTKLTRKGVVNLKKPMKKEEKKKGK